MIGRDGTTISFTHNMAEYWCAGLKKKKEKKRCELSFDSGYINVKTCIWILSIPMKCIALLLY